MKGWLVGLACIWLVIRYGMPVVGYVFDHPSVIILPFAILMTLSLMSEVRRG